MKRPTKWDMASGIESEEDVFNFLRLAIEENDPEYLIATISAIARSKGIREVAKNVGVSREGLYKSLSSKGNPSFATVFKVLESLGYGINIYKKAS